LAVRKVVRREVMESRGVMREAAAHRHGRA